MAEEGSSSSSSSGNTPRPSRSAARGGAQLSSLPVLCLVLLACSSLLMGGPPRGYSCCSVAAADATPAAAGRTGAGAAEQEEPTCSLMADDGRTCDDIRAQLKAVLLENQQLRLQQQQNQQQQQDQPQQQNHQNQQCTLYYAPSTIPEAGWGLFTATDLPQGSVVGGMGADLVLPIEDVKKALPYRGNQRFLPWLSYVWPEEIGAFFASNRHAFPTIELGQFKMDEGLSFASTVSEISNDDTPPNVFLPGVAAQANSDAEWDNVIFRNLGEDGDEEGEHYIDLDEDDEGRNGGTGRSRHTYGGLVTERFVAAGSELFLYYGDEYHEYLHEKSTSDQRGPTLEHYNKHWDFSIMPTEEYKRSLLNVTSRYLRSDVPVHEERGMTPVPRPSKRFLGASAGQRRMTPVPRPSKSFPGASAGQRRMTPVPRPSKSFPGASAGQRLYRPLRDREWLAANGACMDNLRVQESNIPEAGRGAFAARPMAQGDVVSHAPVLHLKRDDMVIYASKAGSDSDDKETILDFEKILGQELMLNYCFGHADSQLLLVPYSPVVNYINHDGKNPNAAIRWVVADEKTKLSMELHPIDVLEQQIGSLRMEYVALREIAEGDEVTIDYGAGWEQAWNNYVNAKSGDGTLHFRHEIGVPQGFYPERWLHASVKYELAPRGELGPGELKPIVWKHNGRQISKYAYQVGLRRGFSQTMRDYSEDSGILAEFDRLLTTGELPSNQWYVFNATDDKSSGAKRGEFFAQRYRSDDWNFNMHYLAAWDETARVGFLGEIGRAGFEDALDSIGNKFDLDTITCFFASYMGVSRSEVSMTHADFYATGEVTYSIIFPVELVEGSAPELQLQTDDGNTVIGFKYEYDTAIVMGDYVYHFTSPIRGYKEGEKRVVVGMSCGQIDESNSKMMAYLYEGEDPAPFMGQFDAPFEYHWSRGNKEEDWMGRL